MESTRSIAAAGRGGLTLPDATGVVDTDLFTGGWAIQPMSIHEVPVDFWSPVANAE